MIDKIEQIKKMDLDTLRKEAKAVNIDIIQVKKQDLIDELVKYYSENNSTAQLELGIIEQNTIEKAESDEATDGLNCTGDLMELCNLDDLLSSEIEQKSEEIELPKAKEADIIENEIIENNSTEKTIVDTVDNDNKAQIEEIDINLLDNSPLNFFSKLSDTKFSELKSSISDLGLLSPILVRPNAGRYEILAGRNRVDACRELGFTKVSAIVKNVADDEAEEIISDTNVAQRDDLKPLEIAKAYEIKARQIGKRQGQKSDSGEKFNYLEKVGEEFKVSGVTVSRYLRLNNLVPEFKEKLNKEEIALNSCFELGMVDKKTQANLLDVINKSSEPDKLLKTKNIKAVKNAFNDKNTLTGQEKSKLKREGKDAKIQSLDKAEIKAIINPTEKTKKVRISIAIPEDASEELKDFVEGNVNADPDWFIGVLNKMAQGLIKY